MLFGYARVSKNEQNLDLQMDALSNYGVNKIYTEKISGRSSSKPELEKLLESLRSGDTFVVWRLDRLGRTAKELISLAEEFKKREINFVSIKEALDTTTPAGNFVFIIFCAIAQMERDVLVERTMAGLEAARARGRVGGRPKISKSQIDKAIKLYRTGEFSIQEIVSTTGVSKSTLYRYIGNQSST